MQITSKTNQPINTLRAGQNGSHFTDDILKCIFFDENVWISIKISLKFVFRCAINNIPALVQIMAWRWLGDKPLSEPMVVNSLMHICVIRPQGVHSTLSWPEHFLNHWKHFWVNKSYPFHGFLWYFYLWSPRLGSLLLATSKHPFLRGGSSPKGSNVGWAKNTTLSKTKNPVSHLFHKYDNLDRALVSFCFNTLRHKQNGTLFAGDIFKIIIHTKSFTFWVKLSNTNIVGPIDKKLSVRL